MPGMIYVDRPLTDASTKLYSIGVSSILFITDSTLNFTDFECLDYNKWKYLFLLWKMVTCDN